MEHEHTPEAIRRRLEAGGQPTYLRDFIYGGIDGAVTTFALVAGTVGARFSPQVILVLGAANIFADGFSMAASNYSATRAELEEVERIREMEYRHIKTDPEGEKEEVRQIFERKGFTGADLERIVEVITSNREQWVQTMLREEFGLSLTRRSPRAAALATFAAFAVCGTLPLLPYLAGSSRAFFLSSLLTGFAFFLVGSAKRWFLTGPWIRSGLETVGIGAVAAALAFAVGRMLRLLAPGAGT